MNEFEKHCGNCDMEYYCIQKTGEACLHWRPDFYAKEEMESMDFEKCESCMIQK